MTRLTILLAIIGALILVAVGVGWHLTAGIAEHAATLAGRRWT